jgi:hypothetical protein
LGFSIFLVTVEWTWFDHTALAVKAGLLPLRLCELVKVNGISSFWNGEPLTDQVRLRSASADTVHVAV